MLSSYDLDIAFGSLYSVGLFLYSLYGHWSFVAGEVYVTMTSKSGALSFQFINSTDASVPKGNAVRTQIRKQAMSRAALARRQRGNYGKHNLRQYPIILGAADEQSEDRNRATTQPAQAQDRPGTRDEPNQLHALNVRPAASHEILDFNIQHPNLGDENQQIQVIPPAMSSTGYESMRIRYDFDILDLSALTTFHVGRATAKALSIQPSRLIDVLRCKQWSYLSYLPSRYGQATCLDDAAHCAIARVRHFALTPTEPLSRNILSLYSKALLSLQAALNDPVLCLSPDVLCATQILSIYEVVAQAKFFSKIRTDMWSIASEQVQRWSLGSACGRSTDSDQIARAT